MIDNAAKAEGFIPTIAVEVDTLNLVKLVVASGRDYGLAPRNAIWPEVKFQSPIDSLMQRGLIQGAADYATCAPAPLYS